MAHLATSGSFESDSHGDNPPPPRPVAKPVRVVNRPKKGPYVDPYPRIMLDLWIKENARHLKPPVSNKQLYANSQDAIIFVSGGPNTRNDFHVNPTEEFFYQLKGDIAVRVRPLDGTPPRDVVIKEGEIWVLPRWVPHRPQRPANTLGLIIEFPRGVDANGQPQMDGLQWYCPTCDTLVHEARWVLKKIDEDLKVIMEEFWNGPEERRTCRTCGHVIKRAGAIELKDGMIRTAGTKDAKKGKPVPMSRPSPKPGARPSANTAPAPVKPATKPVAKPMPKVAKPAAAKPVAKPVKKGKGR